MAFTPDLIAVFVTLFVLEIVLGVDNVIFISISGRASCRNEQQARARNLGSALAMVIRDRPGVLRVVDHHAEGRPVRDLWAMGFSWKDLILIAGGLFLVYKAVTEIHHKLEGAAE